MDLYIPVDLLMLSWNKEFNGHKEKSSSTCPGSPFHMISQYNPIFVWAVSLAWFQDSLKGAYVDPTVNLEIGLMRQRLRIKAESSAKEASHPASACVAGVISNSLAFWVVTSAIPCRVSVLVGCYLIGKNNLL